MIHQAFELVLDGQRVLVRRGDQTAVLLDSAGECLAKVPIQTAAESLQGIFATIETLDRVKNV